MGLADLVVLFHKYDCGCVGIPMASDTALLVSACDDNSGEYYMGTRAVPNKTSEAVSGEEQEKIIKDLSLLIADGYRMRELAHTIKVITSR